MERFYPNLLFVLDPELVGDLEGAGLLSGARTLYGVDCDHL